MESARRYYWTTIGVLPTGETATEGANAIGIFKVYAIGTLHQSRSIPQPAFV